MVKLTTLGNLFWLQKKIMASVQPDTLRHFH